MTDDLDLGLSHDTGHRAGPHNYGRRRFAMVLVAVAVLAIIAGVAFVGVKVVHRLTDKPADWSKFANAGEISGEITKADDNGFTLKVTWYGPKGGARPQLGRGGSSSPTMATPW